MDVALMSFMTWSTVSGVGGSLVDTALSLCLIGMLVLVRRLSCPGDLMFIRESSSSLCLLFLDSSSSVEVSMFSAPELVWEEVG